ncbi:MAG: hypothetical protein JWN34_76 [Bryobacterales bacterium]|nr:hypothetical protein [Bryobacterales bacterium]
MKILDIRTLAGPNVYSHDPALVMKLDLQGLNEVESSDVPGFVDRLLACLPGIQEHYCSLGRAGGFVERLHQGTYFGHVVEHVALELTDAAGISVNRGKTVHSGEHGIYLVAVTYKSEAGMKSLLRTAVELVEALLADRAYPLQERVEEARRTALDADLGPSTRAITDAADRRGVPWVRINDDSLIRLGYGRHVRHVQATVSDRTSLLAAELASNKELTKRVLASAGLPVPRGCVVTSRDAAIACLQKVPSPVVVKPLDGNQGRGVSLNLMTPEQVAEAFDIAVAISPDVIVEEMLRGFDYRVVLVDGQVVAAAQRIPAHVWGDGRNTISQLIDQTNGDPRRGDDHEKPLTRIHTDPLVLATLKRQNLTLQDVPEPGKLVLLRESANLSTGGSAKDVTDDLHPSIRKLCERTARMSGLDICGVDLVLPEISQPWEGVGGIVEVNAAPGIRMHHHPSEGQPRDVGGAILNMLFPHDHNGRIPIVSITGTNGKTTVTRMIAHALGASGQTVGMTTTDGIWIGGNEVDRGDMTGPWSARVVLSDPTVDIAVLETARGGIVRSGLGYDWSDVAVMTNIAADHIGQDGIEDIDDILRIKRLVAERVREGGTLILNADDERLLTVPDHEKVKKTSKRYVYISLDPANPTVRKHLLESGTAFVSNGEWLEERNGTETVRLAHASLFPATLHGTAEFQVFNVLAALAACRACGMPASDAVDALSTFRMEREGSGRLNLFTVKDVYVLVDYGHNPAAMSAVCRMTSKWRTAGITGILTIPGDRSDALIEQFARSAACGLDRVIIREDLDRRGRAPGEVAAILSRVMRDEHPNLPVEVIEDEVQAVEAALDRAKPGEVIAAFCDRLDEVLAVVEQRGGRPLTDFRSLVEAPALRAA